MKNKLTILIPTIKYTQYLDQTIESCLNINFKYNYNIHININANSIEEFKISKYWNNKNVIWTTTGKFVDAFKSIADALSKVENSFILLLSDDDPLNKDFMANIPFNNFTENTIYLTSFYTIDESGIQIIKNKTPYNNINPSKKEIINLFFKNKLPFQMSFSVFHKNMYLKYGPIEKTGYPNGYYADNVFYSTLIANSSNIYASLQCDFYRRISSNQLSSQFYFDNINNNFETITNLLCKNSILQYEIINRYGSRLAYKKELIKLRFNTEWAKLHIKEYKKKHLLLELWIKHLLFWNTGLKFKLFDSNIFIINFYFNILKNKFKSQHPKYYFCKFYFKKKSEILKNSKKIYIYGTGEYAKIWTKWAKNNKKVISGYIISNTTKDKEFLGKPIISIEKFSNDSSSIIILSTISGLSAFGMRANIKYIHSKYIFFSPNNETFTQNKLNNEKIVKDSLEFIYVYKQFRVSNYLYKILH